MDSPSPRHPAGSAPRFDSNRAWQQALAAISANREVLLALAGVFFLLPGLAFSLLFPQPVPPAGGDQKAMVAFVLDTYTRMLPFVLPVLVMQAGGTLGMLTLLTDRSRPTVAEAIRTGFRAVLPYLASQLLLGFGLGVVALPIMILFSLAGTKGLAGLGVLVILAVWTYGCLRTALVAPVMAVDGLRNPIAALTRSWALTRGNALRMLVFLALIALTFTVVLMVVTALVGVVLGLLLSPQYALIGSQVVSATMGALMALTFVAALAATHAQLAGKTPDHGVGPVA